MTMSPSTKNHQANSSLTMLQMPDLVVSPHATSNQFDKNVNETQSRKASRIMKQRDGDPTQLPFTLSFGDLTLDVKDREGSILSSQRSRNVRAHGKAAET